MTNPLAMVIEDNKDVAKFMQQTLLDAGYSVIVYFDGETAVQDLETQTPILVTLDLHLPEMSGEKVLDMIRSDERLEDTRIILVTADDRLAELVRDDKTITILKPVNYLEFRQLAKRFIPKD